MSAPSSISAEVGMQLVTRGQMIPLTVGLHYSTGDPYAVKAAFHVGLDEPVEWTFARDLLREGVNGREGIGDVQIWPSDGWALPHAGADDHEPVISIELSSPFGEALFQAPASDITSFLDRAYRLVPAGREPEHLDVDACLGQLLAGDGPS